MLWISKRREPASAEMQPAAALSLVATFSPDLFARHLSAFVEMADEDGGPQSYLLALAEKSERVQALTARLDTRGLDLAEIEGLLALVFTARRRLYSALAAIGAKQVNAALVDILRAERPVQTRLQAFVDLLPSVQSTDRDSLRAAARVRRAAWDFGAEILHYHDMDRHALMSRWVWDESVQTGALSELVTDRGQGTAGLASVGLAVFDMARDWARDRLRAAGIYREIPLWIDLVLASAYIDYLGAATQGHFGLEFARGTQRREQLRKLLGIDVARACGRSRVRVTGNGSH